LIEETCDIGYVVTTPFGVCIVTEEVSLFVIEPATVVPSFRTMVAGCEVEVAVGLLLPQAPSIDRITGTAMRANGLKRMSVL
jgi:hypothetical protein